MKSVYIDCSPFVETLFSPELRALVPDLQVHVGDPNAATLARLLAGAACVLNGHTPMDEAVLRASQTLRSVVFLGSGPSSYIDLPAAERLGIRVRAISHYGDRTIAEHAFALMLSAARQVAAMDRDLRSGNWEPRDGVELAGKVLGVVGAGGIGREMIRMGACFGMRVLAWNRSPVDEPLPCEVVPLDALLSAADIVSLHVALTPETTALIDARRLALLRTGAILVNTARGAIVDEAALVAALRAGRLAHAALDVFAIEPLPRDHPFVGLPNVTLTAHAGFKTPEATARLLARGLALLRQDLAALAAGESLAA